MPTYTISPGDYNALKAMITHEGLETITRDLKNGNTNSAYGQLIGLTETWLNRAASKGLETNGLQGLMAHPQVSFFPKDQAGIDREAGQLDPRIGQMLDAYLQSRGSGERGSFGGVDHYLNPEVTKALYGLPSWYTGNIGNTLGKFGDYNGGGKTSKQQDFLDIPGSYQVPDYDVQLSDKLQLRPTEGDVNALADFRSTFRPNMPLPPARPNDGSAGIAPRDDQRVATGSLPDQFSDAITGGLERAGGTLLDAFQGLTGRLPSAGELKGRLNDVASGARSVFDQLTDIAGSQEAKTFAQSTGIDPSQYVLNDIYRLGLNRDVDPGSAASQMEVLRNQGGQSLYNQLTNSQEGRSLALGNFYENNFHRDIDQGGLSKYLSDLAAGKSMQAVQTDILSSPEAQSLGITPDQFASLIQPSYLSPSIGPSGLTPPVGPGSVQYPVGPGSLTSSVGPGSVQSPVGPGSAQYPVGPGAETSPVGPGGESSPVAPGGATSAVGPGGLTNAVGPGAAQNPIGPGAAQSPVGPGGMTSPVTPGETSALVPPETQAFTPPETQAVAPPAAVPAFNADAYRAANPDVAAFGMDPLQHFLKFGYNEGRSIDAAGDKLPQGFNATAYLAANPDVASFGMNPLEHFARFGASEGRSLSPTGFSNANVSGGVGNGTFAGTFNPSQYLAANPDVANSGMNPLDHFLRFGAAEGRAVDTAGDHLPQNFDGNAYLAQNQDVARLGMNPLEHYLRFGAAEGRAAPTGSNPFSFSGINASQGLGPTGDGTFHGTFNGADYLAANRDVAASGMNPLDHYLQFGFNEGRAIDTRGDAINKGFDPLQYLNLNQDVKAAGMDPLRHYLTAGASEGRALPTGSNNYSFSNFNVAGGLGNPGNGSFGLGGVTSSAPGGMGTIAPAQQAGSSSVSNPFGFSSLSAGTYAAPAAPSDIPTGGFAPNWESASNNALPGSGGRSGSAWEYTDPVTGEKKVATFDPQKSENAYLAGQVAQNQQQIEAGRLSVANNPNLWNFGASNLLNSVAASNYQPAPIYSTATAQTAALAPTMPAPFNSPLPVMQQGLRVNPYGGFGLISAF